jgi:hypothetical protein
VSKIANHWALQGITVFQSGQPYSIYDYSGGIASLYYSTNDGITNPIVPLAQGYSPKQALTGAKGAFQSGGVAVPALNANAFALPFVNPGDQGVPACGVSTGGAPVCDVFETGFAGNGQRNIFRQSFQKRGDISLVKVFPVTERFSLKYAFDVFNVTNTSSFDIPNDNVSTNSSFSNTPTYNPALSNAANRQSLYSINSNGTVGSGLGLGVVQQTIGSPRLIQMSLRLIYVSKGFRRFGSSGSFRTKAFSLAGCALARECSALTIASSAFLRIGLSKKSMATVVSGTLCRCGIMFRIHREVI